MELLRYAGQTEDILPIKITTTSAIPPMAVISAIEGIANITWGELLSTRLVFIR